MSSDLTLTVWSAGCALGLLVLFVYWRWTVVENIYVEGDEWGPLFIAVLVWPFAVSVVVGVVAIQHVIIPLTDKSVRVVARRFERADAQEDHLLRPADGKRG